MGTKEDTNNGRRVHHGFFFLFERENLGEKLTTNESLQTSEDNTELVRVLTEGKTSMEDSQLQRDGSAGKDDCCQA